MSFDLDSEEISQRFAELEDALERLEKRYSYTKLMYGIAIVMLSLGLMVCALSGCYAQHEALPCDDSGVMPMAGGRAVNALSSDAGGSNPPTPTKYPGPCPFEYDSVHCWCVSPTHEVCDGRYCEGPWVGCIAPGSPVSSTWEGRP